MEELDAWQLAHACKLAGYEVVRESGEASADWAYKRQVYKALSGGESNIDEGFYRYRAASFVLFLSYARSSLAEARRRLRDGVDRRYFNAERVEPTIEEPVRNSVCEA